MNGFVCVFESEKVKTINQKSNYKTNKQKKKNSGGRERQVLFRKRDQKT